MKRNYILGGALVVLVVVLVLLNKPGSFKGSLADGVLACTKADIVVSVAQDSPSGPILNAGNGFTLARFRVQQKRGHENCRLDVSSLAGRIVSHGVSVAGVTAYQSEYVFDSRHVYQAASPVSCARPTFKLLPVPGAQEVLMPNDFGHTFSILGDINGVVPEASIRVELYGPGGIGGVTTVSGTMTSYPGASGAPVEASCR